LLGVCPVISANAIRLASTARVEDSVVARAATACARVSASSVVIKLVRIMSPPDEVTSERKLSYATLGGDSPPATADATSFKARQARRWSSAIACVTHAADHR
jgi:hypothetical protein